MDWYDKQSRIFHLVLYPDSESYDYLTAKMEALQYFDTWCYILHDKDTDEKGELKKPHVHLMGTKSKSVRYSTVCNALGVPLSAMTMPNDKKGMRQTMRGSVRYCLHLDHPDKYQYPFEELVSNLSQDMLDKYLERGNEKENRESNALDEMIEYCREHRWHVTTLNLLRFCQSNDILGYYHRWNRVLEKIIFEEQNHLIDSDKNDLIQ